MMYKKYPTREETLKGLYIISGIVFLIWIVSFLVVLIVNLDGNSAMKWAYRGQIGDSFGAINSLFSGLAFAGIIYTILLQRKELALQRHEIEQSRIELSRSASAQESSEKELRRQADNLKESAKLNALSTLVDYYTRVKEINLGKSGAAIEAAQKKNRGVFDTNGEDFT